MTPKAKKGSSKYDTPIKTEREADPMVSGF